MAIPRFFGPPPGECSALRPPPRGYAKPRLEYPAAPPGYRADLYGTFYCVGGYGHNWSSAIPAGSGSARLFEFRFNWLNPKNSGTRAHGLQLRCLQEKGGAAEPRDEASRSPSSPNPLGENITLSSPPLKPRGLLLSVMRQKVGKERSQGVFAPLANPRRNCPNLAKPSCGPTPAGFAKQAPIFGCQAAPRAAGGDDGSRDPMGRSCSTCRPTFEPPAKEVRPCAHPPRRFAPGR